MLVGFAAESGDPVERGRQKLQRKGADLIVANDISAEGSGFDSELNAATIISRDGAEAFPLGPKTALAAVILDRAERLLAPLADVTACGPARSRPTSALLSGARRDRHQPRSELAPAGRSSG